MPKARVKPGRAVSAMGMVVGLVFVGLGLFVITPMFGAFGLVWTLAAAAMTVFHAVNAFSDRGIATTEIDVDGLTSKLPSPKPKLDFDERLRKLEALRSDGLISETEYQEKRRQMMDADW